MYYNCIVKFLMLWTTTFSTFIRFEYLAPRKDVDDVEMFERRIHVSLDTLDHVERRHGPHGHRHHVKN